MVVLTAVYFPASFFMETKGLLIARPPILHNFKTFWFVHIRFDSIRLVSYSWDWLHVEMGDESGPKGNGKLLTIVFLKLRICFGDGD